MKITKNNDLKIEFINVEDGGKNFIKPIPAIKTIPPWYKKISPLRELYPGQNPDFTIKKCIPVLDAFTTGYYLVTNYDLYYNFNEDINESTFSFDERVLESGSKPITMHPFEQIRGIELDNVYYEYAYKFSNPYVIKTPPGYSCIFTAPFNVVTPFYTITGVVDTDSHPLAVQFPFLMRRGFDGVIKSGTPIVQVIPFKRDEWKMQVVNKPDKLDIQENSKGLEEFETSRYDASGNPTGGEYKNKHRAKKRYL